MSLPLLEGNHAKYTPQQAIVTDTVSPIQGFPVRGTGYPYYAWLPPHENSLFTLSPAHPPGAPVAEAPPSEYSATKQRDERLLTSIISGKVPYDEALKSTSKGFFGKTSNKEHILVHDGRNWVLYKGTYYAQFNWRTEGPVAGAPRYTQEQMNRVLKDLVVAGGTVFAARHKLQDNGFIAGDEDYFWTADGQRYDWIDEKWVLRESENTTSEHTKMSEKDQQNLRRLEEKYPERPNVRRMRTWAGPRHEDVPHDGEERLPAHPTSLRFGNRGVKRKQDDANGNTGQPGNDGNPPVTGGNTKGKGRKPPSRKGKGKPAIMFNFTPLLGAQSSSTASQSLLELDGGVKVLVDVGWDEKFDVADLRQLERQIPTLSIVLLTHATTAHIGAFAHCCKNFPLFTRIPIYATTPVISLGRTFLQDLYASTPLASTLIPPASLSETSHSFAPGQDGPHLLLQSPTAEDIAAYFSLIHPLKYSQSHQPLPSPFSPPLNGLTVTAYNAGHTLGGTIWHIQHGMESIVYAVDWNLIRENVLSGAAWLGGAAAGGSEVIEQLRKPTALVCSSKGAERLTLPGGRKRRDDLLLDMIRNVVGRGGTVLIPTDTSARVLELAYILEHAWRRDDRIGGLKNAKLFLASKNVGATMRYARSMIEWMDENVAREIETEGSSNTTRQYKRTDSRRIVSSANNTEAKEDPAGKNIGPFDFKYLKLLERKKEVERILSNKTGQVILASDTSLEWGFSKEILRSIAGDPANLIILTERSSGSQDVADHGRRSGLSRTLWEWYETRSDGVAMEAGSDGENLEQVYTGGRDLQVVDAHQAPLEGKELLIYQQYLATQQQLQNTIQSNNGTSLETSADVVDETSSTSSSSDESDSEQQGKALNISATLAHANRNKLGLSTEELGINVLLRHKGVYDYDVRGKRGREKMFPFIAKRKRADDFGDLIRPEEYLRAEERDDVDGQDMRVTAAADENKLGQKRKWDSAGLQEDPRHRRLSNGGGKRRQTSNNNRRERVNISNGDMGLNDHAEVSNGGDSDVSEDEADEPLNSGPSKVTFATSTIEVSLRIAYVDFSGVHDKRSLSMMIPLIQPRKLVLVAGAKDETLSLADECRKQLQAKTGGWTEGLVVDVLTPLVGQSVDASVDTNAWTVKLSEALVKRLHWQNVRGLAVVTLAGLLAPTVTEDASQITTGSTKKQKLVKEEGEASNLVEQRPTLDKILQSPPTLDVLPASMAAATRSAAQSLHVGDLRLADLRKILQSSGQAAEFRGEGTLLIDGVVAVRKTLTGRIEVEGGGPMSLDPRSRHIEGAFHAVKKKVYEGLAVVTGG